jgi:hypothetical protein
MPGSPARDLELPSGVKRWRDFVALSQVLSAFIISPKPNFNSPATLF